MPTRTDRYELDPQVAEAFASFAETGPEPPVLAPGDWQALRQWLAEDMAAVAAVAPPIPAGVERESVTIATGLGGWLSARWYTRGDDRPGAAVVYAHGGGMIGGSLDDYDWLLGAYVQVSGVPILSVDYSLAPEATGPRPTEELLAAVTWLLGEGERLGVEPHRIAVMGDSAGGGIAASAAILARDRGIDLARQILIYPMLDDSVTTAPRALEPFLTWTGDHNATGWAARKMGESTITAATVPARLEDFRGLAPAYLEVGDLDLFRDETLAYAQRLAAAEVPLELHVLPSVPHGFEFVALNTDVACRTLQDRARALRAL